MAQAKGFSPTLALYLISIIKYGSPSNINGSLLKFQLNLYTRPYYPASSRRPLRPFQRHHNMLCIDRGLNACSLATIQLPFISRWNNRFCSGIRLCERIICVLAHALCGQNGQFGDTRSTIWDFSDCDGSFVSSQYQYLIFKC